MNALLVDTSVLIKWFHVDGEDEVVEARLIRDAHVDEAVEVLVLDLAVYEVGNVLVRALGWSAGRAARQLDDLRTLVGPPLSMADDWIGGATRLAVAHQLSFYDACWAAAGRGLGVPLASADGRLLAAGLAQSVSDLVDRWDLRS